MLLGFLLRGLGAVSLWPCFVCGVFASRSCRGHAVALLRSSFPGIMFYLRLLGHVLLRVVCGFGFAVLLRPCCSLAAAFVSGQDIFYKTKVESFASFARCFVGIYKNRHGAWCDDGHVLLEWRPIRIAVHTHTHYCCSIIDPS